MSDRRLASLSGDLLRRGGHDRGTLRGHRSCKAQPHRDLRGFSRLKAHAIAALPVKASSSQSGQRQHPLHRHRASPTLQCAATAAGPRQCPLARCCPPELLFTADASYLLPALVR
ncbi:hypothetical protein PF010_g11403 [Phytophthora fragariae]|uniref:Uncharacterized protein n=1 Tax=Phytophthora fragariae TaxID=53985 RepID=A0A6G0L636_9STRA|nr:hypothetical protein PF010_g11403 [Phytophthora fragariae]